MYKISYNLQVYRFKMSISEYVSLIYITVYVGGGGGRGW